MTAVGRGGNGGEIFDLPEALAAKARTELIADDQALLSEVVAMLEHARTEARHRLAAARKGRERGGTAALERDQQIRRFSAQLALLERYGVDLCLGRMVHQDGRISHLGRLGLRDGEGRPLLLDWRTPAAEPFFAATHADPMGLISRRRYRWSDGRITDYWDEVFTTDGLTERATLDDQSAFIASLGGPRTERMRDVLATIQADQHAIIRDGSRGALVVDGGPGTGKTVVALHRTAYLLHADPRIGQRHGGVLFVGPSNPYLDYVSDVLPSLGEQGVLTCTMRQLVPEGDAAEEESDPVVRALKSDVRMVEMIEPAVRLYEEPPGDRISVDTAWGEIEFGPGDWAQAFGSVEPGTAHNEAREQLWAVLTGIASEQLAEQIDEDGPQIDLERLGSVLQHTAELVEVLGRSWPMLEATELVADLWAVPAYLRRCAPWLDPDQVRLLRRPEGSVWTEADLPLLDAARRRLGDPGTAARQRRRAVARAAGRAEMDQVIAHLIDSDPTELQVMKMLRGADLRGALDDPAGEVGEVRDRLAGPFAHLVVDEAQELTDAQWAQLLARCPSRSLTIVGDRAQARHGFAESWSERLARVGLNDVRISTLTVNYRTPAAVMREAEPVIRAVMPDLNVPTAVRDNGLPVRRGRRSELDPILAEWRDAHAEGIACVIGDPGFIGDDRVRSVSPTAAKGLEFDLVVLVDPESFGVGIEGTVDRYVAMTRATGQLVLLGADRP